MVNEEILGGLKLALEKDQPLKYAMETFQNAGYSPEEIEEAAKMLSSNYIEENTLNPQETKAPQQNIPQVIQKQVPEKKEKKQLVSDYSSVPEEKNNRALALVIIILMVVILSSIAGLILFKDNLLSFINGLL